jgi:hypothetical protein
MPRPRQLTQRLQAARGLRTAAAIDKPKTLAQAPRQIRSSRRLAVRQQRIYLSNRRRLAQAPFDLAL